MAKIYFVMKLFEAETIEDFKKRCGFAMYEAEALARGSKIGPDQAFIGRASITTGGLKFDQKWGSAFKDMMPSDTCVIAAYGSADARLDLHPYSSADLRAAPVNPEIRNWHQDKDQLPASLNGHHNIYHGISAKVRPTDEQAKEVNVQSELERIFATATGSAGAAVNFIEHAIGKSRVFKILRQWESIRTDRLARVLVEKTGDQKPKNAMAATPQVPNVGELPSEFVTHWTRWRQALEMARVGANSPGGEPDDESYWEHEIRAFDRTHSELSAYRIAIPDDIFSHKDSWRKALQMAVDNAPPEAQTMLDRAYWEVELAAFDQAHVKLEGMVSHKAESDLQPFTVIGANTTTGRFLSVQVQASNAQFAFGEAARVLRQGDPDIQVEFHVSLPGHHKDDGSAFELPGESVVDIDTVLDSEQPEVFGLDRHRGG